MKQPSCPLNLIKLLTISVAFGLSLCKPAFAEDLAEGENFWNDFKFGGYSSAGITLHSDGDTEAALNEISLILRWDGNGRLGFFSELELEKPLTWQEGQHLTTDEAYIDVERLYFDYNLSDKANIRAGRFLTPAGRWNQL
ncbi:MAG: hypothetical protein ACT4OH_07245, partial [Methylophilaceae bacterium]